MTDQNTAPKETAITPQYGKLRSMISSDQVQERFRQIMGQRAGQFLASVLNTVYLTKALQDCEPGSIITAAITAAALDLPVDPNLGFAWIIPYRMKGNKIARFQIGYKGLVQLALRTRQYSDINVAEIYTGEKVRVDRLTGRITLNGSRTGDEVTGYVAYFKLTSGFEKCLFWTVEEIRTHAQKYSQSYGNDSSTWKTHFDAMARKTVLSNLLKRFGILSIEMRQAMDVEEPDANQVIDLAFGAESEAANASAPEQQEQSAIGNGNSEPSNVTAHQETLL